MPLYYKTLLANKNAILTLVVFYRLYYWLDKTVKEDLIIPFLSYIPFKESFNLIENMYYI